MFVILFEKVLQISVLRFYLIIIENHEHKCVKVLTEDPPPPVQKMGNLGNQFLTDQGRGVHNSQCLSENPL